MKLSECLIVDECVLMGRAAKFPVVSLRAPFDRVAIKRMCRFSPLESALSVSVRKDHALLVECADKWSHI